jgi:ferritin-like metal-binding protein YciE
MPATITDPKKLFLHELGDVLTAERMLTAILPTMENQASDEKLAARLREHLNETRKHVENVNQVFTLLGETPSSVPCPAMEGIKTEQQESEGEASTPELADLLGVGIGARIEHYEIASYEGLVSMAKAMGQTKAVRLLEQNLQDEKAMLRDGKAVARRLTNRVAKTSQGGGRSRASSRTKRGSARTR